MALFSFILWLRSRTDALGNRCAAVMQHRRMRRAEAMLPKAARDKAAFWRTLYRARNARLQREREARRRARLPSGDSTIPQQDISKAEVLAAIARSRAGRQARLKAAREDRENG